MEELLPDRRFLIVVVAFGGVIPFHLSVPCLVFGEGMPECNPFDVVVCAGEKAVKVVPSVEYL